MSMFHETGRDEKPGHVAIEPQIVRIATAVQFTGLSRSRLYELIQSGDLETVKVGRCTLIPFKSLKVLTGSWRCGLRRGRDMFAEGALGCAMSRSRLSEQR